MRGALGAGVGLWLLEIARRHHRLPLAQPVGRLRRHAHDRHARRRQDPERRPARSPRASRPTSPSARSFVMLDRPGPAAFIAGEDTTGDGTALNVRALYQRCPHLGCKPNPCLKNFWFECPCHGSRYDRLGIKRPARSSGRRRGAWTGSRSRSRRRRADRRHRQDHARPAAGRARPARDHPAANADRLHLMTAMHDPADDRRRPDRARAAARAASPSSACPLPRPPAEPAPVERFTSPPSTRTFELTPERAAAGRPPVVERPLGRLPGGRRRRSSSWRSTGSTSSACPPA